MVHNTFYFDKMLPCIDRFISDTECLYYKKTADLKVSYFRSAEPVPYLDRLKGKYLPVAEGERWGGLFDCAWMHFEGRVPKDAKGKKIALKIDVSGEALIYGDAGEPLQGLTSKTDSFDVQLGSPAKTSYVFTEKAEGGEVIDFYADCGCNDLFGRDLGGTLKFAYIAECDDSIRALWYDAVFLRSLLNCLNAQSARYAAVLYALFNASIQFETQGAASARECLAEVLSAKGGDADLNITAIGHSHLDLAWLWPVRETKRKALRTFANTLVNLDKYPDYLFAASQPQQYQWVKEQSPELFARIKDKVNEGRIVPVGALWVEPDLNVPSGESLVRQVLLGKKFFQEEFDKDVRNAWLPDVFGFNAALPQILKKSGVDNLLTIKLSWNRYSKFPHHSFRWAGIDGTEVLVHMPPEGTYNSAASPSSVAAAEHNYIEKGLSREALLVYGIGDGGGGPGHSHLESLARMKNISGLCPVKQGSPNDFFERLAKEHLPLFSGEMYLEKHQGTYTSQGKTKMLNRKAERALFTAELASVMAMDKGYKYPSEKLELLWKDTLTMQFHDILPGSSIARVYDECNALLGSVVNSAEKIASDAFALLGKEALFNADSFARDEIIEYSGGYYHAKAQPFAAVTLEKAESGGVVRTQKGFENGIIRVEFDADGAFTVIDLANDGMAVKDAAVNVYPDDGDGWDISDNYLIKGGTAFRLESSETTGNGAMAVRRQTLRYNGSTLTQWISLADAKNTVIVRNRIDWKESAKMVRADFETGIVSTYATSDIQFGTIKRPTTENDAAEYGKSEICAQSFTDVSRPDRGVTVISDYKNGYRVKGSRISLNLLRSTSYPGVGADIGEAEFVYAVCAHGRDYDAERVAASVTRPFVAGADVSSFLRCTAEGTRIDAVKKCEYDDSVIVRVYEYRGCRSEGQLVHKLKFTEETDMTEKGGKRIEKLVFEPFEIKTLKLIR